MAYNLSTVSPNGDQGTPQGSGERYQSLSAWAAAQSVLHQTDDESEVLCYKGEYSGGILLDNPSTSGFVGTIPIKITAAPGSECGSNTATDPNDHFILSNSSAATTLNTGSRGTTITGLHVINTSGFATAYFNGGLSSIYDSIIEGNGSSDSRCPVYWNQVDTNSTLRNSIVRSSAANNASAVTIRIKRNGQRFDNVVFIGNSTGKTIQIDAGRTPAFTNTAVYADPEGVTALGGEPVVSTFCTISGTSPYANWDNATEGLVNTLGVDFVDFASGDYTPADGGKLKDTGETLGTFSVDMNGLSRPQGAAWDQGPIEAAGAAPGVTFDGPDIVAQAGTEGQVFSFDENGEGTVASRFTGATSYAYAPGSDQPAGITVNATTGNLEGTPTSPGSYDVTIEGSD